MGQSQSQIQKRTAENAAPPDPAVSPEERARIQAEERERRAAAVQQRLDSQNKRNGTTAGGVGASGTAKKKPSALEQMSAENRGWRAADEQAELRSWN